MYTQALVPGYQLVLEVDGGGRGRQPVPALELFGDGLSHSAQAFLPVAGTCWTALVTGTVGHASHAGLLDLLVRRMVRSLRVQPQPRDRRLQFQ